jgi:hypothetical protein
MRILADRAVTLGPRPRAAPETRAAASAFQAYLRQSFSYTIEMFAPDRGEDPIEMFLFRTRKGHCEYFASAMVALCQSVGIDARIVAGYLATEFNGVTNAYIVRESNAHAWVEVELEPGRWTTMDPSPPDVIARLHRPAGGLLARIRHVYEAMEFTWVNAVVTFDEKKRSGLVGSGEGWSAPLRRVTYLFSEMRERLGLIGIDDAKAHDSTIFFAGAVVLVLLVWWARRLIRSRRYRKSMLGDAPASDPALAELLAQAGFYDRAIRALERAGIGKPRYRPPLTHAGVLADANSELAAALGSLAGLYYRVRFARRPLDPEEAAAAEALADDVERASRPAKPVLSDNRAQSA